MYPLTFRVPALSHDVLDLVYPAPRAGRNPEHNMRLHHRDLALRSLDDLQREQAEPQCRDTLTAESGIQTFDLSPLIERGATAGSIAVDEDDAISLTSKGQTWWHKRYANR
jgi:hypothetical protein